MAKVEKHWKYENGTYLREDGARLVKNKHSYGVAWWVQLAGHDTPLQIKGQPHLRRAWRTVIAAMKATNKEYPISGQAAKPKRSAAKSNKPTSTPRVRALRPSGLTKNDPFVFIGHGFGTSYKCLECYLWFARPVGEPSQAAIVKLLPAPVAVFARFRGELLHFGSDDALEERIVAAYRTATHDPPGDNASDPTRQEWRRFCEDFERAVRAIHHMSAVVGVVKPDDGTYGKSLSSWHQRSIRDAARLATRAVASPQSALLATLAMNLFEDVVPSWNAARRIDDDSRAAWLRWLDALIASRHQGFTSDFVERATWLYATSPEDTREALLASVRPATQKKILAATRLWKQ